MHRVFVYGTLKRGFRNHRFLQNAVFAGKAHTLEKYRMLDGRFPVLLETGHDLKPISGEAYDVDGDTLNKLDAILIPRVNAGYVRNDDPATAPVQVDPVHGFDPAEVTAPANQATFGGGADPFSQILSGAMSVLSHGASETPN